jgi:hypothetical protein
MFGGSTRQTGEEWRQVICFTEHRRQVVYTNGK